MQGIMDKNAVKEIMKEYKGREYTFPIGVKATNVETDNSHQFVTKTEKTKIGEIDGIRQAFTDGCNVLVSACTTYGTTPESNSPSHIADAIRDIYNKRYSDGYNAGYSAGRLQGQKDVIADPGAYGIDQIKNIYQHETLIRSFDDITHMETATDYWDSFSHSDSVEYQIELKPDRFLYAVTFDLEYYAIRGYESPCNVSYAYSVKTAEGTVIQSDSIEGTTTGSTANFGTVKKNILVDLLQKPFATDAGYLILTIGYSMAGQVTSAHEQICQANISFTGIQARYK